MSTFNWYDSLVKPSWAPPNWLFGPVWSVLYIIIAISYCTVFYEAFHHQMPLLVTLPFALNLVFNFAFTPIHFGLQDNYLASVDILLVFSTLIWSLISIYSYFPWVVWINIPHLIWVFIAVMLQLSITYLNR